MQKTIEAPFSERNGFNAEQQIEELLTKPKIELTQEELQNVQNFAHGLFNGEMGELKCQSNTNLKEINQTHVLPDCQTFFLGYFSTEQGLQDLEKMNIGPEADIASSLADIEAINSSVTSKERKRISKRSGDWLRNQVADNLFNGNLEPNQKEITVHYNPEALLAKLEKLKDYKTFYSSINQQIKATADSPLGQAQKVLIQVHVSKVNSMIAELYPTVASIANQLDLNTDERNSAIEDRLVSVAPVVVRAARADEKEYLTSRLAKSLDFIANGVAFGNNGLTSINPELQKMSTSTVEQENPEPSLSQELIDYMDKTIWGVQKTQELCGRVLAKWDLLSEYGADEEETDARIGPAEDNKWQIITQHKKNNLLVNGPKKVICIPHNFSRSLSQMSPAGILPVLSHELTHVLQNEYDQKLGETIPLASIRGARYLTMREMGGIAQEQELQAMLGRNRLTSFSYLNAFEVMQAGGTLVAAAREFYETQKNRELNEKQAVKARFLAADRTLRLYRHGGYNSQPLDYAEQAIILNSMSGLSAEQKKAIMIAGSSFSLADSVRLHSVGMLELPTKVDYSPVDSVMEEFLNMLKEGDPDT